jgi:hypothetical protein
MSESSKVAETRKATVAPLPDSERRSKRRAKIAQPVRVRPSEPSEKQLDEVLVTLNVCRNGLYFATDRDSYYKRMRLFITFPYSAAPGAINLEYIGQVVRIDPLAGGRWGIAVQLVVSINLTRHETYRNIRFD